MQDRSRLDLEQLGTSDAFREQAKKMGILNLRDVLDNDIRRYKEDRHFDYVWYADLLRLLKKEGLLDEFERNLL